MLKVLTKLISLLPMPVGAPGRNSHGHYPPDARVIFDLITSNNLGTIRSLLGPLTLCDRQAITYQKVDKTTLLCYACKLGFKDIVKYLLDECGADIQDYYRYRNRIVSPMRVAIKKLDFFLMAILMRRGAIVDNHMLGTVAGDRSPKRNYYTLVSIMRLYKSKLYGSNLVVFRPNGAKCDGLFQFSWSSELAYDIRSDEFLAIATSGDVDRMKTLLTYGVNKEVKNFREENALCAAIMYNRINAVHFLINFKAYSLKSYVMALEFCGAKFILFGAEFEKGLEYWRQSVILRRAYRIGFEDKHKRRLESDLGVEFETVHDIKRLENQHFELLLQTLMVFRRVLPRSSEMTHTAYVLVSQHRSLRKDLVQPLKLLSELYELPPKPFKRTRCPTYRAVSATAMLFNSCFLHKLNNGNDFIDGFSRLCYFLERWGRLLRGGFEFYRIAYREILDITLRYIFIRDRYELGSGVSQWFVDSVSEIVRRSSYPYPTTLLHRAVSGQYPASMITFLLECSGDANCFDAVKDTPLHLVALLPRDVSYVSSLLDVLIKAGGHVDSVNKYGVRPIAMLKSRRIIRNPLNFITLQCLAAVAVYKHKIPVSEKTYPETLVKFIRLHSSDF